MRRLVLALAATVALLCACGERADSRLRTVEYGGRTYEVDQENQTISFDGVVCAYSTDGSGKVTFTAPNGAIAYWQQSGGIGHGGWSEDWQEAAGPGELMNALKSASGSAGWAGERSGNPLLGLMLLAVGAFNALVPKAAWYLSHGWRYKDAEPSEAALAVGRISGGAAMLLGIILFFV